MGLKILDLYYSWRPLFPRLLFFFNYFYTDSWDYNIYFCSRCYNYFARHQSLSCSRLHFLLLFGPRVLNRLKQRITAVNKK